MLVLGYLLVDNLQRESIGFVKNADASDLQNQWTNKHKYTLLLNEENTCTADVLLLIAVLSAPQNLEMRQTIRKTYGTIREYKGSSLRVIFLLGTGDNESTKHLNPRIKQESDTYHDIIKGDFIDHYDNLTYKTVLGLYWVHNYCKRANYVFKIDDDTILNVYKVLYFLHELRKNSGITSNFLYCKTNSAYPRPRRTRSSKFYVSYTEYPYTFYPHYCAGPGYLFSSDVAMTLYQASKKVPFLRQEDVYISFCAISAGIPLTDDFFGFYLDTVKDWFYWPLDWVILRHFNRDSEQWYQIWNNSLSSPAQHSQTYYQSLKLCFIIIFISVISICFFFIRKRLINNA